MPWFDKLTTRPARVGVLNVNRKTANRPYDSQQHANL